MIWSTVHYIFPLRLEEVLNCESSMSDIAEKNKKIKQNLRRLYDEIDDIVLTALMSERYTILTTLMGSLSIQNR